MRTFLLQGEILPRHPDGRTASNYRQYRLPRKIDRPTATIIVRLKTGCVTTPGRLQRSDRHFDPDCGACGEPGDEAHILLGCKDRRKKLSGLQTAFWRLALPCTTPQHILRPEEPTSVKRKALRALIGYVKGTGTLQLL
ncbi:hypothetical protein IscW_ISCW010595 [Ixodes scapularis]|uniref:Uncharacterized protein n=1 Tax=Ixodes scapularis TaxID=6945 RepID=B7Q6N5_IXOSC|nr:hypothetical protein IscW_ISCW010595 [Ixodes scapularis]|eukprot:XP_002403182.1 hypothetical protein IscW_ISCW010595 [Ixodes scapularis]